MIEPGVVELLTEEREAARRTGGDEVDGHALVAVRALHLARRKDADHGPQRVGDSERVRSGCVAQQHAYPAALRRLRMPGHLVEEGVGAVGRITGGGEACFGGHRPEVSE